MYIEIYLIKVRMPLKLFLNYFKKVSKKSIMSASGIQLLLTEFFEKSSLIRFIAARDLCRNAFTYTFLKDFLKCGALWNYFQLHQKPPNTIFVIFWIYVRSFIIFIKFASNSSICANQNIFKPITWLFWKHKSSKI